MLSRLRQPEILAPLLLFAVILVHGSWLGLSDDEAYYWVLAQRPALGYAFHPPAVAWSIRLSQLLTGWFSARPAAFTVRLPAAAFIALVLGLGLAWVRESGAPRERLGKAALALLSFAGLFALSWMMVPDLPLLLGWTLAFVAGWRLCFGGVGAPGAAPETSGLDGASGCAGGVPRPGWGTELALGAGVAIAILSKYSGILAAGSAGLATLLWAPRGRKLRGALAVCAGSLLALVPVVWWNAHHQWASILYQVHERQGGGISLSRYARFWAIEWVLAGPVLVPYLFVCLRGAWKATASDRPAIRYALAWILPGALVFCMQPLWADFKPHWAFVVWWPVALVMARAFALAEPRSAGQRLYAGQVAFGLGLGTLVITSCHLPLLGWASRGLDPRLDVTNDLYGWRLLPAAVQSLPAEWPVLGSRYQTAAQAAFALAPQRKATLLPRDLKALDEWPVLGVSEGQGPGWPRLTAPALYVADNRYDELPHYPGAVCARLGRVEDRRWGLTAKWIDVWKCEPGSSRP